MSTALNALKMLRHFSNSRPEIGLTQLAQLSDTNKATALRHLRALEEFGLIEQDPVSKAYLIGPAALRLAALREIARPGIEGARSQMRSAMQDVGESLHLTLLEKETTKTALVVEAMQHSVRVGLDPTEVIPINATASGLIILAFGPDFLIQKLNKAPLRRYTEATLTDPDKIREQVTEFRKAGWSSIKDGYETGVHGFAAPIFGIDRLAIGSIAFAIPENRVTPALLPKVLTSLHTLSCNLTAIFGGQLPEEYPTTFLP